MKSQDQQLEEANRKNLNGDEGAQSDERPSKRRERFASWLGESPGVQIVSLLGQAAAVVSVIVAAVTYYAEAPERTKEKHYQAWQAINAAHGQGGSGGRIEALQDLNEDKQSLVGLSAANAFLEEIDLAGAELDDGNLQGARLSGAELQGASLRNADLRDAYLGDLASDDTKKANLQGAHLEEADARGADLTGVNLQGTKFNNADLNGAVLDNANLQEANLKDTVLENADLIGANLQRVDFENADLWYADLSGADLRGAKNLTQEQIDDAFGDRETELPEGLQPPSDWVQDSSGQLSEVGPLPPGDYSTTYFDAPMSFNLGEGWENTSYESDTFVEIDRRDTGLGIFFAAPKRVYDPQGISSAKILPLPKDMVAWLRDHPYLHPVDQPVEVDVGGVTATQFDVQIPTMPEDYPNELCEEPCLPIFVDDPGGTALRVYEGGYRIMVLSVQGTTVLIFVDLEEESIVKVQEILRTLEWEGVYSGDQNI